MDWARTTDAVKRRRAQLGLSQRQAAARANKSPTTWGQLETHGGPVDVTTLAAMSRALGWPSDALARIGAGDDPAAIEEIATDDSPAGRFTAKAREFVHELVDGADDAQLIAAVRGMAWAEAERRHGAAYLHEMEVREEPWWAADYPPSIEDFFYLPTLDFGGAFDLADEIWRRSLDEFEAEVDARADHDSAVYLDMVSHADYDGPERIAADAGDVDQLDADDARGEHVRPQPPPMTGDEGA
jgi:transcriptional regulator with XRE-family HTH domain